MLQNQLCSHKFVESQCCPSKQLQIQWLSLIIKQRSIKGSWPAGTRTTHPQIAYKWNISIQAWAHSTIAGQTSITKMEWSLGRQDLSVSCMLNSWTWPSKESHSHQLFGAYAGTAQSQGHLPESNPLQISRLQSIQSQQCPSAFNIEQHNPPQPLDEDDLLLQKFGYTQELHRGFNGFMNFSFCFTAFSAISGASLMFQFGLTTGGPVVMVWGLILGSIFSTIVGASMAEICSSYPSAGSVYHWAGMLADREWAPFASYICGCFNFAGNAAGDASFAFGFAQIFAAVVAIASDGQTRWGVGVQVSLSVGVSLLWAVKNLMRVDHQGWFNNASAIYQVASTFIVIVCILWSSPTLSSNEFVWTHYHNETGMPSVLYVSCIGLLMCLYSSAGYRENLGTERISVQVGDWV